MKIKTILVCFFLFAISITLSIAQTPVVESFDYEDGPLTGLGAAEAGWGGEWEVFEGPAENMNIMEGSLELPGLDVSGNLLEGISPEGSGCRAARALEATWPDAGITYWFSFIMEIDNSVFISDSWQGVSFFLDYTEVAYFGKNWGNDYWGIIASSLGHINHPSEIPYFDGRAWLVIKVEMSGDANNEMAYLWVNPDPGVEPDVAECAISAEIQLNTGFNQIACHLGQSSGIVTWYDEVRLGFEFGDVTLAGTSVQPKPEGAVPADFELKQNYPNPFNPVTTIEFNLGKAEDITLKIYNIAGQELATLAEGHFAPGQYEATWNARDLPSGVYFSKLQAGGFTATKKLILQK